MTTNTDELYHHGIKGMRWGVRKQRESSSLGSRFRAQIKKKKLSMQRKSQAYKARKTRARRAEILKDPVKLNKHKNEFSNEEIKKALERFDLEKKLSQASRDQIQKGADWIGVYSKYATNAYVTANQVNNIVSLLTGEPLFPGKNSKKKDG